MHGHLVTIASTVFNGVFDRNLLNISSPDMRAQLSGGQAYAFASRARHVRNAVPLGVWAEVVQTYKTALNTIWWLSMGIAGACFCLVWLERAIPLRKELDTQYGIDEALGGGKRTRDVTEGTVGIELIGTTRKS